MIRSAYRRSSANAGSAACSRGVTGQTAITQALLAGLQRPRGPMTIASEERLLRVVYRHAVEVAVQTARSGDIPRSTNMKAIAGKNFTFHASSGVPEDSEEEIAHAFLGAMATLKAKPGTPVFMGGPNPAGRILAAEQLRLADGTTYILVRAATPEENENPGF